MKELQVVVFADNEVAAKSFENPDRVKIHFDSDDSSVITDSSFIEINESPEGYQIKIQIDHEVLFHGAIEHLAEQLKIGQ